MISSGIDWLSVTFKVAGNATKFLSGIVGNETLEQAKPKHSYDSAGKYTPSGIEVMWIDSRDDMGIHVVFSGTCIKNLALRGVEIRTVLASAIELHARVSRLDLAIDAENEGIDISTVYQLALDGLTKGTARNVSFIQGIDGGKTLYIGSRESDKFARLYDKAKEQKIDGDWKRLEIELKGDVAKEYARVIAMHPNDTIQSFCWSTAKKMLYTDHANYPAFGKASEAVFMPKVQKQTDTEKWLSTQIIPIVEKFVRENPDSTIYDEMIDALIRAKHKKLDKLGN